MDGRDDRGRFKPGNGGRRKGSRNKATQAALSLLDGEGEAITRKCIDLALQGDATALRLALERIAPAPKDSPVRFKLPKIERAADAVAAAASIVQAVAAGKLTPSEGAHCMSLVESYRRTLETSELEQRVQALEDS